MVTMEVIMDIMADIIAMVTGVGVVVTGTDAGAGDIVVDMDAQAGAAVMDTDAAHTDAGDSRLVSRRGNFLPALFLFA